MSERTRADDGVSLIELVVAMTLATLVGAMALTFFVKTGRSTSRTTDAGINTAQARVALDSWTGLIRVADSPILAGSSADRFERITPTDLLFYADVANRPGVTTRGSTTKIWLKLINGRLIEQRYVPASGTFPSTPTYSRVLASNVTANGWVFTPWSGHPAAVTQPNLCAGATAGLCSETYAGGLSGADSLLQNVSRVDISFQVTGLTGDSTQTFTSTATITGSIP